MLGLWMCFSFPFVVSYIYCFYFISGLGCLHLRAVPFMAPIGRGY